MKAKIITKMNDKFKGFTLVELIVVISILAILGAIAFTQLGSFQGSARDSNRITDVSNLQSGLEIFQIKSGYYPLPDADEVSGISTGTILGLEVAYKGVVGDMISRHANMSKTPADPLDGTQKYTYGITYDKKQYQIGVTLENTATVYNSLLPTVYAGGGGSARVDGTYDEYIKFSTGGSTYLANVPSLIFNFSGATTSLFSTDTYFVYNNKSNLPYRIGDITDINIVSSDTLIQNITNTPNATLTGVNITGVTKDTIATVLNDDVLKNFTFGGQSTDDLLTSISTIVLGANVSVNYNACTLSGETIPHGQSITGYSENTIVWNATYDCTQRQLSRTCNNGTLGGDTSYQYTECVKGVVNNCSASGSYVYGGHTYSIPQLNHSSSATNILSSNVSENNGTFKYTLTNIECNDGVYANVSESGTSTVQGCDSGYGVNGNTCSASQNGSCNNTVALGCSVGSAINDNGQSSCGTTRTWNCSGLYGGGDSVQCSLVNPTCRGEQQYTTPGSYTWTAPAGVTSVSVVCVGGGGIGGDAGGGGGGGGGLGWKNNINVTPGNIYTVVIATASSGGNKDGNISYFKDNLTVAGLGGKQGISDGGSGGNGGTYVGDGGGNGGKGGTGINAISHGGGGGAGGYNGNGGTNNTAGSGGGGGGGSNGTMSVDGREGGGVGLNGAGINGTAGSSASTPGGAGSGGNGISYGGGAANTPGGAGACRIVWPGTSRTFPSTDVGP